MAVSVKTIQVLQVTDEHLIDEKHEEGNCEAVVPKLD